jgi:hypothetical protein
MGWDEGVVEQMQRLLRPQVLAFLGITVNEGVFAKWEIAHEYNGRILALEHLRHELGREDTAFDFYRELLSTPLRDRPGFVLAQSRFLPADEYKSFVRVFSAESVILRKSKSRG